MKELNEAVAPVSACLLVKRKMYFREGARLCVHVCACCIREEELN